MGTIIFFWSIAALLLKYFTAVYCMLTEHRGVGHLEVHVNNTLRSVSPDMKNLKKNTQAGFSQNNFTQKHASHGQN